MQFTDGDGIEFGDAALLTSAEALEQSHRYAEARELYALAAAQFPSAATLTAFATFLRQRERYGEAISQLTRLLDLALGDGPGELLAWTYAELASIYRDLGHTELSWRFQRQAMQSRPDCDHYDLSQMAADAIQHQKYDAAIELLQESAELSADSCSNINDDAHDIGLMGVAVGLKGEPYDAVLLVWQAYRLHLQTGDVRSQGIDLMNLSEFLGDLGRASGERRCLERAIRKFTEAGCVPSAARARRALAWLDRHHGIRNAAPWN